MAKKEVAFKPLNSYNGTYQPPTISTGDIKQSATGEIINYNKTITPYMLSATQGLTQFGNSSGNSTSPKTATSSALEQDLLVDIIQYSYQASAGAISSGSYIIDNWRIELSLNGVVFYMVILDPNCQNVQSGTGIIPLDKFIIPKDSVIKARMTQDGFNGNNVIVPVLFTFSMSGVSI